MRLFVFLFLSVFSAGCEFYVVSNRDAISEVNKRYAMIITDDRKDLGSAISIGNGYFLSAFHVVQDEDSGSSYKRFSLIKEFPTSETARRDTDNHPHVIGVDTALDLVLFSSAIGKNDPKIQFDDHPNIGDNAVWIQPAFYDDEPYDFYLKSGIVSKIGKKSIFLDLPIFSGISGGGILSSDGKLLGIAEDNYTYENQIIAGSFVPSFLIKKFLNRVLPKKEPQNF